MSEDKKPIIKPISSDDLQYRIDNLQAALSMKAGECDRYLDLVKKLKHQLNMIILWTESVYRDGMTLERKKTYERLRSMVNMDSALKRLQIDVDTPSDDTEAQALLDELGESEPSESV